MQAFDPRAKIPETMIDVFVDRIVYDKGVFSWYLNPKLGNETFKVDTTDWKKSMLKSQKKTLPAHNSTGCNCGKEKLGNNIYSSARESILLSLVSFCASIRGLLKTTT